MKVIAWRDFCRISLSALILVVVAGCGGGGGGSPQSASPPPSGGGTSNAPPTIQGQPSAAVVAGQPYTFTPTANDPNGDALTFTATNLPGWATINPATGRISGTPTSSQVGTYSNIRISVSDGQASASLTAFSIAVTDVGIGSATISWTAPTLNTDGSALTDLAGYEIRYGQSAVALNQSETISTVGTTTHVIGNLSPGTWYFSVAARNAQGVTSNPSGVASKVIG